MSQLKSKTIFLLLLCSFFFSVEPELSEAESDNETERILVTYEQTKSPSRDSKLSTKVEMIDVPVDEVDKMIEQFEANKDVQHVEMDQPVYLMDSVQANDTYLSYQKPWIDQIHLIKGWELANVEASSLKVAVIDSGVDLTHPDLKRNLVDGINLVEPSKSVQDIDGHGTKVSGLIGAVTNNQLGVVSPSRGTSIMPIKVTENGTGNLSTVVQGIRYAIDHDADVINLSLGNYNNSFALRTVIEEAISKNILIVGAAGNDNDSGVVFPAAYPDVLAVASVKTGTEEKASFSNYGSLVDIAAPGTDIYSTSLNGEYAFDKGTSMSAPIVASSGVLLKEYAPYLTNKQTFKLLKQTASALTNSYDLGSGVLNMEGAINGVTEFNRIYGDTAIDTAIEISKKNWTTLEEQTLSIGGDNKKGRFVVLTRSDDFPDSLAASPLASMLGSPILLTKKNSLSVSVMRELSRLSANHVLVIGGNNAIPEAITEQLKSEGISSTRIAGDNRYETATKIANIVGSEKTKEVFIVSGEKFPDALSISSFASRLGAPVLFTKSDSLPAETKAFLNDLDPDKAYVIGGESIIGKSVYSQIKSSNTERIGGEDRFDTNFKVLLRFGVAENSEGVYFATGLKFPDALTGGAAASLSSHSIILVHPTRENNALEKSILYLNNQGINQYRILGGPAAINQTKAWDIDQMLVQ
ncbi:cell wall-binding repeat-containing protein [Anaerobacillus sp. 1_MG-2023]|uniref:cell wall-binding repeat-containing protein n=1 Tax=Anaerobacillus sp. 1_MG-2023 TaxID=3062655 RepID=UPI0026E3CFD4|nr:cell wall-binding repeat-containing protein [Anaerobacillus sp. 1_MG-2023]MDO6657224.1 cell wall-binding repeat-containing protein [Anaerobacillus sp. 1_MG-2023]